MKTCKRGRHAWIQIVDCEQGRRVNIESHFTCRKCRVRWLGQGLPPGFRTKTAEELAADAAETRRTGLVDIRAASGIVEVGR